MKKRKDSISKSRNYLFIGGWTFVEVLVVLFIAGILFSSFVTVFSAFYRVQNSDRWITIQTFNHLRAKKELEHLLDCAYLVYPYTESGVPSSVGMGGASFPRPIETILSQKSFDAMYFLVSNPYSNKTEEYLFEFVENRKDANGRYGSLNLRFIAGGLGNFVFTRSAYIEGSNGTLFSLDEFGRLVYKWYQDSLDGDKSQRKMWFGIWDRN